MGVRKPHEYRVVGLRATGSLSKDVFGSNGSLSCHCNDALERGIENNSLIDLLSDYLVEIGNCEHASTILSHMHNPAMMKTRSIKESL